MKTKIFLVRHGESLGNAARIYLGHTDLDLSEEGHRQAKLTAESLRNEKIDAIYSSDLKRAYNTALPHAAMRGLEVVTSRKLRELNIGDWEGKRIDDLIRDHHEDFVTGWQENFGTFTIPGGENVFSGGMRFHDEVLRIARENPDKTLLIAAHAAVIRCFWCIISGVMPEDMAKAFPFPKNASYSTVICDGERLLPLEYSVGGNIS